MDIVWWMQHFAGQWHEGMYLKDSSKYKVCDWKKGVIMPVTHPEQWGADRNGLVKQSLIGEHMVRITLESLFRYPDDVIPAASVYRFTIGMFWIHGRGDPRYNEFMCRCTFKLAPLAWQYGTRLAKGATLQARND